MTAIRIALRAATLAVAAAAWLAAAWALWRTEVPAGLELPRVGPRELADPESLREAVDYAGVLRWLWVAGTLAVLAALACLAAFGPRLARRLPGGRLRRGLILLALSLTALWLVRLPFGAAAHWWRRRHGISRQAYLDWLVDPWLELAGGALIAAAGLAVAMLLARRLGRRWWLAGGPALALLGAASILVQPLLLAPKLEPLRDARLAAEIRLLGDRLGVGVVDVDVKEAHRSTKRANAEVTGLGPTRRVVLWDTLLDGRFTAGEIRFLAAHELAHVARRHLWKGAAWFSLLALPIAFVVAEATRRLGGLAEPAAVPLAVLVAVAVQVALLPVYSSISRRYEAEADWLALRATREPAAARSFFSRLVVTNLAQPDPPAWAQTLLGDHPPLVERVAMTEAVRSRRPAEEAPRAGS